MSKADRDSDEIYFCRARNVLSWSTRCTFVEYEIYFRREQGMLSCLLIFAQPKGTLLNLLV